MGKINKEGLSSFMHPNDVKTAPSQQEQNGGNGMGSTLDASISPSLNINQKSNQSRIEIRRELLQEVKNAADSLNSFGLTDLANQIIGLVKRTMQTRFSVSFVGEFNHGKSTLINKLLGQEILPTGNLPTTALLTRISFGSESAINVLDATGKQKEKLPLTKDSWGRLVAYNEEGEQSVLRNDHGHNGFISVTLSNEWMKKTGIDILDTPGVNDGNKKRDMDVSRALMATDGAVLCVDAQKGLMETQRAFIKDRLMATKVPFMALVITHLDLISMENRDRQVAYFIGELKQMKIEMPIFIANDVEMPSGHFANCLGIDNLKMLLARWSANSERADKMETWLAANVCHILSIAQQAFIDHRKVFETEGEEREKLLIERKTAITAMSKIWEELRKELEVRCNECKNAFERRYEHEVKVITKAMNNRIDVSPNPKQWYEKSYKYELSTRLTAAIMSLDSVVTERARNDFEWLNKELVKQFKINAERNSDIWKRTEEQSFYVHQGAPDVSDVSEIRQKETIRTSVAIVVSGIIAVILTSGTGGLIGTVGVGTVMRHISEKKINEQIGKIREQMHEFILSDVPNVLKDSTMDCENRIRLIYSDMVAGAFQSESNWMKTQHSLIEQAAQPSIDAQEKALNVVDEKLLKIDMMINNLIKYIH